MFGAVESAVAQCANLLPPDSRGLVLFDPDDDRFLLVCIASSSSRSGASVLRVDIKTAAIDFLPRPYKFASSRERSELTRHPESLDDTIHTWAVAVSKAVKARIVHRGDWIVDATIVLSLKLTENEVVALKAALGQYYYVVFTGGQFSAAVLHDDPCQLVRGSISLEKGSSDPQSAVYVKQITTPGLPYSFEKRKANSESHYGVFGTTYNLKIQREGDQLIVAVTLQENKDAQRALQTIESCRFAESAINSNFPAYVLLPISKGVFSVHLDYQLPDQSLVNLLELFIDGKELEIQVFFDEAPASVTNILKQAAAAEERTLSGVAMQWIKGVAEATNVKKLLLTDAWDGSDGGKQISSENFKLTTNRKLRERRAQYHDNGKYPLAQLEEDLQSSGYYGLWGFQPIRNASKKMHGCNISSMRVLRGGFCDLGS